MQTPLSFYLFTRRLLILAAALLCACQPVVPPPAATTPAPSAVSATAVSAAATTAPSASALSMQIDGVATGLVITQVEASAPDGEKSWWQVYPAHQQVTLEGYPVTSNPRPAQVFIYPLADLEQAGAYAADSAAQLQTLLDLRVTGDAFTPLPLLPPTPDAQMLHAQAKFLDFAGGSGARYLTQLNQGMVPLNNTQMLYTFQGISADGRYYVAAVLPVTHPELPNSSAVDVDLAADYAAYRASTAEWLEQQPADAFTPNLDALDALVQSLQIP